MELKCQQMISIDDAVFCITNCSFKLSAELYLYSLLQLWYTLFHVGYTMSRDLLILLT